MKQLTRTSSQIRGSAHVRTVRSAPRLNGRSGAKSESANISIANLKMHAKRAERSIKARARRTT